MRVLHTFLTVAISVFIFFSCTTNNDSDYTLTTSIDPPTAGIVTPSDGGFQNGSEVEISAVPNENMVFSGWRGDFMGNENPTVITMNSNKNLIAFFYDREYPLNILIEGEGAVSESILQEKSTDFAYGTIVELTATPAEGWKLVEWRGDLAGSENPGIIKMDKAREVTAVFGKRNYALSINIEGEGRVSEQVIIEKSTDYQHGTHVALTAHPADGWIFSGWDSDLDGNENPTNMIIEQEAGVTAIFIPVDEIFTFTVQGEGTVDVEQIESDENPSKNLVRLTARPFNGWRFNEWQGDVTGSDNPVQILLTGQIAVNAVFEIREYPLTILTEGEGNVTEHVVQQKTTDYNQGTIVELTANPSQGWEFIEWQGDLSGSGNPKQLAIDSPKNVTAVFAEKALPPEEPEEITYNLAMNIQGEGSVNINPRLGVYEPGTLVALTATPSEGWEFKEWSGDIRSTLTSVEIIMDSDKNISAVFSEKTSPPEEPEAITHNLTINIQGEGTVSIAPEQEEYQAGTIVAITASPSEGWEFVKWSGDMSSNQTSINITMDSDKSLSAIFAEEEVTTEEPEEEVSYNLAVNIQGEGSVNIDPDQDEYVAGTVIALTATPSEGWEFVEWQGDLSGSENPNQLTMDSAKDITAVFTEVPEEVLYNLAINTQGEGSVSINPDQDEYEAGTIVALTASPSEGWEFVEWKGDLSGSENPNQLTMDGAKEITAVFTEVPEEVLYNLTINTQGEGSVSINPNQDEYETGTVVTLTASPSEGWEFDQWEGDFSGTDNPFSITIENTTEITAVFLEQETTFMGGDGSSGNPYQVSTVEQLQSISEFIGSHFIQVNNIDAASTSGWNGGQGFRPIGTSSIPFTGTYNGNGFEISELAIDRDGDNPVGLFGFTGSSQITNTGIVSVNITGENNVGGLAGTNNGQIHGSYVSGSVSGDEIVGGLVAVNNGQITNSHSRATVMGDDEQIGGLVGANNGEISKTYATGRVTGEESVGGLVGSNRNNARILNSYASGRVSGEDLVGGLAGRNYPNGVIASSYASGSVSGDDETGGFIGWNQASLDSCYWDTEGTDQSNGIGDGEQNGLIGLTTSEMSDSAAESNMSRFDWIQIWKTVPNNYPVLQ